jgi:hypothetical protein
MTLTAAITGLKNEPGPRATGLASSVGHGPVVIDDLQQLADFSNSPGFTANGPLVLRIPAIPKSEAFAVAERLNKSRTECGCSLGAKAMGGGFVIALVLLVLLYGPLSLATLVRLPLALAAGVLAALVGKAIGIALGHRRAHREVTRILTTFRDHA